MTDYSARVGVQKKAVNKKSWRLILSLFLMIIFTLAAINGIAKAKGFLSGNKQKAGFDLTSSFILAVDGSEDYLTILQNDPKRLAIFKLGDRFKSDDRQEFLSNVSKESGVVVKNFLISEGQEDVVTSFEKFKSFSTPVKVIFGGFNQRDTNISRYDAIRLWWQTISISAENVDSYDLSGEIATKQQVLGENNTNINRNIKPYVENIKILRENLDINIMNGSGDERTAAILEVFITSVGGHVSDTGVANYIQKCEVVGKKSYTREYLAKTYGCDIKDPTFGLRDNLLTIVVGQEFREIYF